MQRIAPYFDYRRHVIRIRGLNISYWDEGSGQPLVLVHGLGGFLEYWAWVFPQLVGRFRVIAFDLPGFGKSTLPAAGDMRIDNAVGLLRDFIGALKLDRPLIVGHSMGGAFVLRYAAANPGAYSGIMALCPPGFGREIDFVSRVLTLPLVGERLFQPTHATIFSTLNCPGSLGMEHLVRLTYERLRHRDARNRHLTILRQGVDLRGQTQRFRRQDFAGLTGRVKIVWGERDWIFPVKHAARAAELLPNAELTIIPAGHIIPVEQPAIIARLITELAEGQSVEHAA